MGRPQKRGIDTVNHSLKKRRLDVKQARRMVNDRSVWRGFVRGNVWRVARGRTLDFNEMPPLSCSIYMKTLKGKSLSVAKPTKLGHKGEIFCFSSLS